MLVSIRSTSKLDPREEVLFRLNSNSPIESDLLRKAFKRVLGERNEVLRNYFLLQILSGLMIEGPTSDQIITLLDVIFEFDGFSPGARKRLAGSKKYLTVGGSGKKGFKTINISSPSAFIVAVLGINVVKLCSPSTSSSTGSQDFITILSGNDNWLKENSLDSLEKIGIGFFPCESVLPKFASIYSGRFLAPHAISFALAGMATEFVTDGLYYGISHSNTDLSLEVFKHYGHTCVTTVSSSLDGEFFIDEVLTKGEIFISKTDTLKSEFIKQVEDLHKKDKIEFSEIVNAISQDKDPIKNVIRSLSGLSGANSVLASQFAINAAFMLSSFIQRDLYDLYKESLDVINSGEAIKKAREYILLTKGNVKNFDKLLKASL